MADAPSTPPQAGHGYASDSKPSAAALRAAAAGRRCQDGGQILARSRAGALRGSGLDHELQVGVQHLGHAHHRFQLDILDVTGEQSGNRRFFAGVPGFLVRTSADPLALAPAIRAELATPPAGAGTTEIGERTLGPIRLQGRQVQEGLGRTEYWVHYPPVMETAADPLAYPPIVVEMTIFMDSGERFEIRAISAQRIPPAPDIFAVPGPVP